MMGLWCWKQDFACFLGPEELEDRWPGRLPACLPPARSAHTPSDLLLSGLWRGKVGDGVGKAAVQTGMISIKGSFPSWLPCPPWVWTKRVCCPASFNNCLPSDDLSIMLTLSLYQSLKDEAIELNVFSYVLILWKVITPVYMGTLSQ